MSHAENLLMLYVIESCYGTAEARERGFADLSYTTLQDATGLSRASIARALNGLRKRGLLDQKLHSVQVQRLRVVEPRIERVSLKFEPPVVQKRGPEVSNLNQTSFINKNQESMKEDDESLADLLLQFGYAAPEAGRLYSKLIEFGRDVSHLKELLGYVAQRAKSNPKGLLHKMIVENQDVPQVDRQTRQGSRQASKSRKAGKSGAQAYIDRLKQKGEFNDGE
jgi:hypothetical protein